MDGILLEIRLCTVQYRAIYKDDTGYYSKKFLMLASLYTVGKKLQSRETIPFN